MIEVHNLAVTFPTADGDVKAVNVIDFEIAEGETVGNTRRIRFRKIGIWERNFKVNQR